MNEWTENQQNLCNSCDNDWELHYAGDVWCEHCLLERMTPVLLGLLKITDGEVDLRRDGIDPAEFLVSWEVDDMQFECTVKAARVERMLWK